MVITKIQFGDVINVGYTQVHIAMAYELLDTSGWLSVQENWNRRFWKMHSQMAAHLSGNSIPQKES